MRLSLEVDLPRPPHDCLAIAAAMVVVSTDGGVWTDGGWPVDVDALRAQLVALDPEHAGDPPGADRTDRVAVRSGRIDWVSRVIETDCDISEFLVSGRMQMDDGPAGGTRVRAKGVTAPHKAWWRLALFMAAPAARMAVHRVVRKRKAEWAVLAAKLPAMGTVTHQSSIWVFEPAP